MGFGRLDEFEKNYCEKYVEPKYTPRYSMHESTQGAGYLLVCMILFSIAIAIEMGFIALLLFGLSLIFHFEVTFKLTFIVMIAYEIIEFLCKKII